MLDAGVDVGVGDVFVGVIYLRDGGRTVIINDSVFHLSSVSSGVHGDVGRRGSFGVGRGRHFGQNNLLLSELSIVSISQRRMRHD